MWRIHGCCSVKIDESAANGFELIHERSRRRLGTLELGSGAVATKNRAQEQCTIIFRKSRDVVGLFYAGHNVTACCRWRAVPRDQKVLELIGPIDFCQAGEEDGETVRFVFVQ